MPQPIIKVSNNGKKIENAAIIRNNNIFSLRLDFSFFKSLNNSFQFWKMTANTPIYKADIIKTTNPKNT